MKDAIHISPPTHGRWKGVHGDLWADVSLSETLLLQREQASLPFSLKDQTQGLHHECVT